MPKIMIESYPNEDKLADLGVYYWDIWEKEVSEFPWKYDEREKCYILEGKAEIVLEDGDTLTIEKGDLIIFPRGLKCTWKVTENIRKHYMIG